MTAVRYAPPPAPEPAKPLTFNNLPVGTAFSFVNGEDADKYVYVKVRVYDKFEMVQVSHGTWHVVTRPYDEAPVRVREAEFRVLK